MMSIHFNYADRNNRVFCKKANCFVSNDMNQGQKCIKCDYFRGSLQGEGVECEWDDPDATAPISYTINPRIEKLRVNTLIGKKLVKDGEEV